MAEGGKISQAKQTKHVNMRNRSSSIDSGFVEMDFLLPNGFIVAQQCNRRSSLGDIRVNVWEKAVQLPAANLLRNADRYVMIGVTKDAVEEEFDDAMTIDELDLIYPMLEVSEPKITRDINRLYHMVGETIGIPLQALDSISAKDREVKNLRDSIGLFCREIAIERQNFSAEQQALFFFPPKFDLNQDLPFCTAKRIMKAENKLDLDVWIIEEEEKYKYRVTTAATDSPVDVIAKTVAARLHGRNYSESDTNARVERVKDLYVLKVCGKEEYMLVQRQIHTYEYIRSCINKSEIPVLQITYKENMLNKLPNNTCVILQQDPPTLPEPRSPLSRNIISSWDVPTNNNYCIKVHTLPVCRQSYPTHDIFVEAQIFHGETSLSSSIRTLESAFNMAWTFDVGIQCLPRCARLCLKTCAVAPGRPLTEANGINWVNLQIFDFAGTLVTGEQSLGVWDFPTNKSCKRRPLGISGGNPDRSAQLLKIKIVSPYEDDTQVVHPSDEDINAKIKREERYSTVSRKSLSKKLEKLDKIVAKDPFEVLSREEASFLWENRMLAMEYEPNLLPKLTQCVNWTERHDVFELYRMLQKWPTNRLALTTALQMLGPQFPDTRLRNLAVAVLRTMITTEMLELYNLQLVQALKFESYMDNSLCQYLLGRAITNKAIGHHFFWNLRSEMHEPLSKVRFSPLLEAYCLYCGSAILEDRFEDVAALQQYQEVSKNIKQASDKKEDEQNILKKWLSSENRREVLEDRLSPLASNIELGKLCLDECKLMNSKQKPLWLTWKNKSALSEESGKDAIRYIVKDGDDLRQDMLVLQLFRVMDMVWKYTCHDYWMSTYACMAMGDEIGMIEVVEHATTVCNIHQEGSYMIPAATMHKWIYQSSQENVGYVEAVRRFTHSCAAYSVATYILGIGDRHSDNIMMSESGQVFHIDFGHFMNHKKSKAGIKRERTPFVLTNDFVRVISMGDTKPKENKEFNEFLYLCYEAFMTIRREADLFLTLLGLMMHCDLPELSEMDDLNYCRKCLCLDKSDHEAGLHFMSKIFKSYEGQWTTKIDWFFHRFNKSMKSSGGS